MASENTLVIAGLYKNDDNALRWTFIISPQTDSESYYSHSGATTIELKDGDKVRLVTGFHDLNPYGTLSPRYTTFTGFTIGEF